MNPSGAPGTGRRGRIVRRYFFVFAVLLGGSLAVSALLEMGFRFQETRKNAELIHRQMADLAALRIRNYIEDIAHSVRLAAQPRHVVQGRVTEDYLFDLRNLLKNVRAIRDLVVLGRDGREQLRLSRIGPSWPNASADHTSATYFTAARVGRTYFGPVTFPTDSFEPRIMIAAPIEPFRGEVVGVLAAEVNVRYVWDVVQEIRVGRSGYAYVVSDTGTLVAHPDLHLVLRRTDLSKLPQVAAMLDPGTAPDGTGWHKNLNGQRVLVSHARIPSAGWTVLVERPLAEAYAPLLASLARTGGILLVVSVLGVGAAIILGRRVVRPIEAMRGGAMRLEAGDLESRLQVKTGDEFEELAEDFNRMAGRLQEAYAGLEQKSARLEGLLRVSQAITATLDPEQIVPVILNAVRDLMEDTVVRLWAARDNDGALVSIGSAGLRGEDIELRVPSGEGLVGGVASSGQPLAIEDMRVDPRLLRRELIEREGLVSFLGLPLLREGRMLGVLAILTRVPYRFTADDVALFASFAQQAAIALENARLYHDLKRSHGDLVAAQEQLVRKARMATIGEIAAAVAHEARNPLGAVSNCVQLLRGNPNITGEDAELLEIVHTESQRLNEIVSDFLAFGRPRPPHFEEVDIHEVIEATQTLLRRDGRCASSIVFVTKFDQTLPLVRADRDQLRQVFWNLFLNAVQAMGDQGELRVETRSEGSRVQISVQDTGPGIPTATLGRLFEPFYTTRTSGTGLGLAIVRRIVEEHGGEIRVDSEPDMGACFTLTLDVDDSRAT